MGLCSTHVGTQMCNACATLCSNVMCNEYHVMLCNDTLQDALATSWHRAIFVSTVAFNIVFFFCFYQFCFCKFMDNHDLRIYPEAIKSAGMNKTSRVDNDYMYQSVALILHSNHSLVQFAVNKSE